MAELDNSIALLAAVYHHRKANPTTLSDELYYGLILKYFQRIKEAQEEGKPIAAASIAVPAEILLAMDIVPMSIEYFPMLLAATLNRQEEALTTAKGYGMVPEICSAHRCLTGAVIMDWLPRPDMVIWSNMVCDNTVKCGDFIVDRFGSAPFFLDVPYRYTERETLYLTQELEDMVHFLEEQTHRKMDWDKFKGVIEQTRQELELHREIYELRKAVPSPSRNRLAFQLWMAQMYYSGDPLAIPYLTSVRDEIKERVDAKKGYIEEENFRLLTLFLPPLARGNAILDWMEREHGAVMVADTHMSHWGKFEIDPSKPLESIARKCYNTPVCRQMHGPLDEDVIDDVIRDAEDYKADGAIYYAHTGCRQACATIRTLKDALKKTVDIPMLTIDMDIIDPTFVSEEEVQDKLEGFFEILEDRK